MDGSNRQAGEQPRGPYLIVLGNEKGGTGKSTTAMHLIVALLRLGYTVGSLDLDSRQSSLTRYLENRRVYAEETGTALPMPRHRALAKVQEGARAQGEAQERGRFERALHELRDCGFVVVDTPGSDSHLSRLAHERTDILITPLNDSFLDIDVLARIDRRRHEVVGPSHYTQMVWEQNNRRAMNGAAPLDWIVMRNRLTHIEARNKREIAGLMELLAHRIGFRLAPGFGERVGFRELFLNGLTLLDRSEEPDELPETPSQRAARAEVEALLRTIGIEVPAPA
ncbi:MAG TPA: division plane positioning ATPase MipZ [Kiloniellales bacterium]|nr:division plane positioning ATPase MipZ [Kiloniellales bacterium]